MDADGSCHSLEPRVRAQRVEPGPRQENQAGIARLERGFQPVQCAIRHPGTAPGADEGCASNPPALPLLLEREGDGMRLLGTTELPDQ